MDESTNKASTRFLKTLMGLYATPKSRQFATVALPPIASEKAPEPGFFPERR
jgi:hypothetical protein